MSKKIHIIGSKYVTNEGYTITIVAEHKNYLFKTIEFQDEYKYRKIVHIDSIRKGRIKNPFHKSVLGVGYFGVGKYKSEVDGAKTKEYNAWKAMINRCHDVNHLSKFPTYKNVSICEEWYNFQNFAKWYEENYPNRITDVKFDLDKDWLQQNVEFKIYSPSTCIFLPKKVNYFLNKKHSTNKSGYVGVCFDSRNGKWISTINDFITNKQIRIGIFKSKEDANICYLKELNIQIQKVRQYLLDLNYLNVNIIYSITNPTPDKVRHEFEYYGIDVEVI